MRHGKYIGPHRELRGCGALIRPDAMGYGGRYVLAQFDRVKADEARPMMFGWHCLPARHFRMRRSLSQAHWRKLLKARQDRPYVRPAGCWPDDSYRVKAEPSRDEARKVGFMPELAAPYADFAHYDQPSDPYSPMSLEHRD